MNFQITQLTHIGARDSNQDYSDYIIEPKWACFMVADGLGGHDSGEIASKYFIEATKSLCPQFSSTIASNPTQGIKELLTEASARFRHSVAIEFGNIDTKTTLTLCWVNEHHVITAQIGDSRLYRITNNQITWRTADHTVGQQHFEQGVITEEEISDHPLQNRLLRSINTSDLPHPDICLHPPLRANETLLLCTDGFWSETKRDDIEALTKSPNLTEAFQLSILDIAQTVPRSDNITVLLASLT